MSKNQPRTWLITGADKGLGRSTAKAALERGDQVVVTVLAADGKHDLSAQYPEQLRSFHLDARHHARFPEVVEKAHQAFGRIDILINNAGYGLLSVAETTPAEKYRPMFEVNFFGLVEMTHTVLPYMRRQRSGHIINLSSIAGFCGATGFSFYSASKFAVEGYSEALSQEIAHLGIHVTIIEPGGFRSDFAGPSLIAEKIQDPDYESTNARIAGYVEARHGHQPNDPDKFGPAICQLVDADTPPLRLPLGVDCLAKIREDIGDISQSLDKWATLSSSTKVSE